MDLSYGEQYEDFRAEVREFLGTWPLTGEEAKLPADEQAKLFRDRAVLRGYMYRSIPRRYGGSEQPFDILAEEIISDEFDAAGVPWRLISQSVGMLVPTLLEVGSEAQKERFIPKTLRGDYVWCQGYSEPGAGSDLASLRSTARLEGDEWILNGHKIWTSDAQDADYMFGLFRTDPEAGKHAGISYLLLDMHEPGVEVRPLKQLDGAVHFNEVFLNDARTPADWIVLGPGQGWKVANVTLKHERTLGGITHIRRSFRLIQELCQRSRRNGRPALSDPTVRQRLAAIECVARCAETSALRRMSAIAHGEEEKVALINMINKLYTTDLTESIVRLAYDLLGDEGLVAPLEEDLADMSNSGTDTGWVDNYLSSLAGPIAAGSSNIQRNIIGERGLGLPRDLRGKRA